MIVELNEEELDLIRQGLAMLHSYYIADESSAEEVMDEQLEKAERVFSSRDVDLTGTPDFDAAAQVLEESKTFCGSIEDLQKKLGVV